LSDTPPSFDLRYQIQTDFLSDTVFVDPDRAPEDEPEEVIETEWVPTLTSKKILFGTYWESTLENSESEAKDEGRWLRNLIDKHGYGKKDLNSALSEEADRYMEEDGDTGTGTGTASAFSYTIYGNTAGTDWSKTSNHFADWDAGGGIPIDNVKVELKGQENPKRGDGKAYVKVSVWVRKEK
jgi:hypothetical protein